MAKKVQYESPQAAPDGMATPMGGPSESGVKKAANARSEKRHAVKSPSDSEAYEMLPQVGGESLDKAGIDNANYIVKKNVPYGVGAMFNTLPPGMDIEDQENSDIREEMLKNWNGGLSYPGDGYKK
jgi:hypothetical protein